MSRIKKILIVGGGTSGWLSAAILAKKLDALSQDGANVTLVEFPDIPTIGVREGTFPTMLDTLQFLGINENEFIRNCNATLHLAPTCRNIIAPLYWPASGDTPIAQT